MKLKNECRTHYWFHSTMGPVFFNAYSTIEVEVDVDSPLNTNIKRAIDSGDIVIVKEEVSTSKQGTQKSTKKSPTEIQRLKAKYSKLSGKSGVNFSKMKLKNLIRDLEDNDV